MLGENMWSQRDAGEGEKCLQEPARTLLLGYDFKVMHRLIDMGKFKI